MNSWATERGITIENAELRSTKGGFGLFTTSATSLKILFVPQSQLCNKENYQNSVPFPGDCTDKQALILIFLYLQANKIPGFKEYLSFLPKEADYPLLWDPESIEYLLLQGTGLDEAIEAKKRVLEQEFEKVKGFTMKEYIWAEHMVSSRSMESPVDGHLFVCPILDFCNHDVVPNAYWEPTANGIELRLYEPLDKDVEIVISYGSKPNSELLFLHGFVLPRNPIETSTFMPPYFELNDRPVDRIDVDSDTKPVELSASIKDKKDLVKRFGFDSVITLRPPTDSFQSIISDSSLSTMYLCMLTSDQGFKKLNGHYYLNETLLDKENFLELCKENKFHDILLLQVWSILADMVSQRLELLSQELEDDIKGLNERVATVELYRSHQVKILERILPVLQESQSKLLESPIVQEFLAHNQ